MSRERRPPDIEPVPYRNPVFPDLDIEVFTLAEMRRKVPQRHLLHSSRPDFHQLMLVTQGRTPHYLDFVRYDCRAGTVLHARPGQVQQLVLRPDANGQVVLFTPAFLLPERGAGEAAGVLVEEVVPAATLDLAASDRRRVEDAFDAITAEYGATDGGPVSRRILQHLLHALLLKLVSVSRRVERRTKAVSASVRTYDRFVRELERRFALSREVADYARALGYSTKTLGRACLAAAGASPKDVIERRVVLEAKRLLAHTRRPVGTIAAEIGFSESTNFVKFFRRLENQTPSEFRAAHASVMLAG